MTRFKSAQPSATCHKRLIANAFPQGDDLLIVFAYSRLHYQVLWYISQLSIFFSMSLIVRVPTQASPFFN